MIVNFSKKDIPSFVEFRHKSKKESPFLNDTTLEIATKQQKEYSSDHKKAYLIKDGNNVIGQLFLRFDPKTKIVSLGLISVLKEHQGKGYAKKLLSITEEYAKNKKAKKIELYVDKQNTHAIKVYEKTGYIKLKDHGKNRMLYIKNLEGNITQESLKSDILFKW